MGIARVSVVCGAVAVVLVAVQGWMEFTVATGSSYLRWPQPWDVDRYTDYLLTYQQRWQDQGINGLLDMYRVRPPYSLTLLVTSLPVMLVFDSLPAIQVHLLSYVLFMDAAAIIIARRLTGAWLSGWSAVLALSFGTILVGYSKPEAISHASQYQVIFPLCALNVFGFALAIEGLYTRKPVVWGLLLTPALVGALCVRPPMVPFIAAVVVVPLLGVLIVLGWCRKWRHVCCGMAGTVVAAALCAIHFATIAPFLLTYFRWATTTPQFQVQSKTEALLWYYWRGLETSPLFVPSLVICGLVAIARLPRCWLVCRHNSRSVNHVRPLAVLLISCWAMVAAWLLPTISPTKSSNTGYTLVVLAIIFATVSVGLWGKVLLHRSAWTRVLPEVRLKQVPALSMAIAMMLCAALLAREYSDVMGIRQGTREDPFRAAKEFERHSTIRLTEYLTEWCSRRGREGVWAGYYGTYGGLKDTCIRIRDLLAGRESNHQLKTWNFMPEDTMGIKPELVLLPSANTERSVLRRLAPPLAEIDYSAALRALEDAAYRKVDTIDVGSGVSLEVFQASHPVPLNSGLQWP